MGEIVYLLWRRVSANTEDVSAELIGIYQNKEAATADQIKYSENNIENMSESWIEKRIVKY